MSAIAYHYTESSSVELVLSHTVERHYPWHIHADHWTIGLVLDGNAVLGTKDGRHVFGSGECYVVRPGETHRLDIAPQSSLATLCIGTVRMESAAADFSRIFSCAETLAARDVTRLKILGRPFIVQAASSGVEADTAPLSQIFRLLIEKPEEPLSVPEMAALAGYSHWHFLRRFHAETGMTPHAFQLACRLRRARLLLREKTTAADTAAAAGVTDQSHMHKGFKLHHGLTPRQFLAASFML